MTLKEFYKGKYPCDSCTHNKVCNVRHCFEETEFKTTHPYVDIVVKCTEYRYSKTKKRERIAEIKVKDGEQT